MAEKFEDPTGGVLARTEAEGFGVMETRATDVIPATIHGFAIEKKLGPYPADAPASHRKAIYVFLRPVDESSRRICQRAGQDLVMAMSPLTPEGASAVAADPGGRLAEKIVRDTLAAAWREVRKFARD